MAELSFHLSPLDRPLTLLWTLASLGAGAMVAYALRSASRLQARLQGIHLDGVHVLVADDSQMPNGPATLGFPTPAILVPRWVCDADGDVRALVLAHEREHLRARDPQLLVCTAFCLVLAPWLLPLWHMHRRLRLAVEVDCDARVLRHHPNVRRYAETLLVTAERAHSRRVRGSGAGLLMVPLLPDGSHLTTRITTMTAPARHSLPRLVAVVLGAATLSASALALPVPPSWLQDSRPAEVAGLYWMVAPDMPSALLLAPAREFTYLRLAPDGKSRLENITVDATRERVAPSTEVTAWSTMPWRVRGAAGSDPAELCWQLGATLQCHPYRRDVASGDLTLYRSRTDGRVDLILRRASPR